MCVQALVMGHAMAQRVSLWPLTAEAPFRARVSNCGIYGEQMAL